MSDNESGVGGRHSIATHSGRNGRRKRTAEPDSDDQNTSRQRRRRHSPQADEDEDDGDEDQNDEDQNDEDENESEYDDGRNGDAYDPDQPLEERRRVQRDLRGQQKPMRENPDQYLQEDPTALLAYFAESALTFRNVKQTAEAAIDSRGLVIAADLSARRLQRLTAGMGAGGGVDVDEFVSKCITFMRHGGDDNGVTGLPGTQRPRRDLARSQSGRNARGAIGSDDSDEDEADADAGGNGADEEDGDMRDWAYLGRYACVPSVRRPAVPGFLLGPLSVEKKARKITKRTAPLRLNQLDEVRPQELQAADLKKSEAGNVPNVCKKIYDILMSEYTSRVDELQQEWYHDLPRTSPENQRLFEKYGLRQDSGLCMIRFVVNPDSFGQTVENLFYTSFLIKDRGIKLSYDSYGLPSIMPVMVEEREDNNPRKKEVRHQAIMSLDMAMWRDLIEVFNITKPMIPHREEETTEGPGERGWY